MAKRTTTAKRPNKVRKSTTKNKKSPTKQSVRAASVASSPRAPLMQRIRTSDISTQTLHTWNKWLAVLYGVGGVVVLLLSTTKLLPATTGFLTADSLLSEKGKPTVLAAANEHLFDVNLAYLVAAALFLAAITHLVLITKYKQRYQEDIARGANPVRWVGYGLSAAVSIVTIGLLSGIYDFSALLMLLSLIGVLALSSLMAERGNGNAAWLNFAVLCLAGVTVLVVIGIYLGGAIVHGSGDVPSYLYWVYGGMVVLAAVFAANMYLRLKRPGNYAYIERNYMLLHLVALVLLTWQIYAGALRP